MSASTVLKYQLRSLENLPVKIWDDSHEASKHIARSIALAIRQKQQYGEKIVLGLATGSSPIKVYEELVRMHREEGLSFKNVNIKIFNRLQHTITGWPGGKPDADDAHRPERALPAKKRVVIFSPHPDDDVISMGGTFLRLVEQGHDVHVAYQTSGNIAVHDHDARRFLEFLVEFQEYSGLDDSAHKKYRDTIAGLNTKQPDASDVDALRHIKGFIRRGEARAGARFCGLDDAHIHFLDMPFYETGRTRKKPLGKEDIQIIIDLLQKVKPHQVFAAGDLANPHGTHRVCLDAIFEAFRRLYDEDWMKDCWLWLYRGAWHEWAVDEIEMAVPLRACSDFGFWATHGKFYFKVR